MHRVAHSVATDLHTTIVQQQMEYQHPEMNTLVLQEKLSHAKKLLLQVLALVRWRSSPRVVALLDTMQDAITTTVQAAHVQHCRKLDAMYYVHSEIHSMMMPRPRMEQAYRLLSVGESG